MRVPPKRGAIIQRLRLEQVKIYRHNVTVHWGDTDPAKIVFYPNYFEWFDQSTRLYFDSVGLDWDSLVRKYGIVGLPIVEAKARFLAPCKFRDEIVVESRIGKWNDKTFEVGHAVVNGGVRAVEGYEIRVWAQRRPDEPDRLKAIPIHSAICSDVLPNGSTPMPASSARMSGSLTMRTISAFSFDTISRGVPAGANTPIHNTIS